MKLIGSYTNGNSRVRIYDDGTKIRETNDDEFNEVFPENIDLKITNRCDMGCPMCHENSYEKGAYGDINAKFIETLRPYTECALGGGNVLSHPDFIPLLKKLKEQKVIANITLNQVHFMSNLDLVRELINQNLIHGIGVSLTDPTDEFIKTIQTFDNAVIHVINGVVTYGQLERLADKDLKLLILGYKDFRRGVDYKQTAANYIKANQVNLKVYLKSFIPRFKVVSFDNLAIEQLDVRSFMSKEKWNEFYMGDDGCHTMYIDLVTGTFAKNSVAPLDQRYKFMDSIDEMFAKVKEMKS